ncbi:hypothetical protein C8R44DRAFT_680500, partial [Mycena epipterygia]
MIRSLVSKSRARLAFVDHEMSRLREQIKSLEEEHVSLSSHLVENTAILSSLRRMPPEVLGEIFSRTLPLIHALKQGDLDVRVEDSPWVLTHVSSHWRAVALATPSLWSL